MEVLVLAASWQHKVPAGRRGGLVEVIRAEDRREHGEGARRVDESRPLELMAKMRGRGAEGVAVRAAVAGGLRVARDHLADGLRAAAADRGEPLLVEDLGDHDEAVAVEPAAGMLSARMQRPRPRPRPSGPVLVPELRTRNHTRLGSSGSTVNPKAFGLISGNAV